MNVFGLLANAALAWGERIAVRYGDRTQTYRELSATAAGFGAFLRDRGIQPGDRVAIFLKNGFEYPAVLFGLFRAGFVAVPINAKLHQREVAFVIENSGAKAIVLDAAAADALESVLKARNAPQFFIVGNSSAQNSIEFAFGPDASGVLPFEAQPDDPAWIFYTSGTTGRPKGATLSHRNLVAMAVNCLADIYSFQPNDRVLHAAPLSHGSGMYLIPSLARGAENIIDAGASFEPNRVLRLAADLGVTAFAFLAPTMIVRLLDADASLAAPSLRAIVYGGAPIHLEHLRAAVQRFGPILVQLYGQGEAPMTISYLPARAHESADSDLLRSAGFVRTGVDVEVLDDEGRPSGLGEAGEIAVRGDVVMRGYWENAGADAAAFVDSWLRTGDIGRFDDKGRLHILDRRHDTIISGGANIYPREIEEVLTRHSAVKEAIVFGVPDLEWGESVAAAVVLHERISDVTPAQLIQFCRDHLASFKKPKTIRILPELPKNAYGKVLRRELQTAFGGSNPVDAIKA
jgi:acyl-CoA synthetase (AMP-forming)/AMP-acid ligase II